MPNTTSKLYCELNESELAEIAVSLGQKIVNAKICEGGLFNTTYYLESESGQKWILRVGPIHKELLMYYEDGMMSAEAEIFRQMEEIGVPCSHVVALGEISGREYMIVDYIPSSPLSALKLDKADWDRVMDEVNVAMARMHRLTGPGYGRASEVLRGRGFPDWFSHVLHEVVSIMGQSVITGCFTNEEGALVIKSIADSRNELNEVDRTTLCHGDLWSGNILVTGEPGDYHLAGIIDVDRAVYGDVDFDGYCPWMPLEDDTFIAPKNTPGRKLRREIYNMMYNLFEAHVWHVQYMNEEISVNAKQKVLESARKIIAKDV